MISWFQSDAEVIRYGTLALRFQCISFPAHSWIVMSNMMEQSIGRTVSATFLSAARQGVFFIPAILLLNFFLSLTGVQVAQAVADLLTLVCAIPIHIYVLKTMEPLKTNTL
jgi:Na+-driven multidrug efflux pump